MVSLSSLNPLLPEVLAGLCESLPAIPDGNRGVLHRGDAGVVPSAKSVCQGKQVGELGDADGLRVYVVLVNWGLVRGAGAVTDVILEDEAVEPSSRSAAVFRAVEKKGMV